MAELDAELSHRLARLAEAVPVSNGHLDPVHRGAVEARQQVRLAWVTRLIALVAILAVAALNVGPFGPGASQEPSTGPSGLTVSGATEETNPPVSATVSDGPFELTLRSAKSRYATDEPILLEATFSYSGDEPIQIVHGSERSPVDFGILEPVMGGVVVAAGGGDRPCIGSSLDPGHTVTHAFWKSGGWTSEDPLAAEYEAFFGDPVLRLSQGTWHPYAVADFYVGECVGDKPDLRVELAIEVTADTFESPVPEPGADVSAVDDDGTFRLELVSHRAVYTAGDPLDIVATLVYLGGPIDVETFSGGIQLTGTQTDGSHSFGSFATVAMCVVRPISDLPHEFELASWRKVRSLSAGTWRIHAEFRGDAPACTFDSEGHALTASIDIAVIPAAEPARPIPLLTAANVEDISSDRFCRLDGPFGEVGVLELHPGSGLGLASETGDVQPIRWPPGFTAEMLPDGAILYGERGQIVAREGDDIGFPASVADDGILTVCGQFSFG
jgi:hypothetical protein